MASREPGKPGFFVLGGCDGYLCRDRSFGCGMDHLYGVIRYAWGGMSRTGRNLVAFLLPLVLMVGCSAAWADTYPASSYWVYCAGGSCPGAGTTNNYSSASAACKGANTSYKLGSVLLTSGGLPSRYQCLTMYDTDSGHTADKRYGCFYGGTLSGTSCVSAPSCPSGQVRNATTGQCEAPCQPAGAGSVPGSCGCQSGLVVVGGVCAVPCEAGTVTSSGYYDIGIRPDLSAAMRVACAGSCEVVLTGDVSNRALVGGEYHYYMHGEYQQTGGSCSGATAGAPASSVPDDSCPSGWQTLVQNGQNICYSPDTGETNDPNPEPQPTTTTKNTTVTENPDGTKTTTTTETGADGSTTTTTTTCDAAGNCSSSTTKSPGSGQAGSGSEGEEEEDDPLKKFCEDNPKSQICKEEADRKFEGSCDGWQCEGDAIDCAAAKAAWEMRCDSKADESTISYVADAMTHDGSMPGALKGQLSEDREIGSLDTSGFLGGGGCVADRSFSVVGETFVLPLSKLCPSFEMFGWVMLTIAGLISARIITGVA